jgi:hypothetical protein
MDYEAEVLRAPQYVKGELLDDLLGLKKQFPVRENCSLLFFFSSLTFSSKG